MEDGDQEQQDIETNQDKNNLNRDQQRIMERQYPRKETKKSDLLILNHIILSTKG